MSIPEAQAATAALLRGYTGVEPIETHISAVFMGAEEVFKLRKAVRLSFVDFTSLAARRRAADREQELNTQAAPGLYRGIIPVTRELDGALVLDGSGSPVEWLSRMARIAAGDFLDAVSARGPLDPALLDAMADGVAAWHARRAPITRDIAQAMRSIISGNARAALDAGLPARRTREWLEVAISAHTACAGWMAARGRDGFVRRGHGDLHLANFCLWSGRPVPFDALEFDEDLATIDTGYDLAFLLMDLDRRAGRPAANRVLNRYVARSGDTGLVIGLALFLSIRAMVRAHVEASRFDPDASAAYHDRALRYLTPSPPPVLLALGGLPGTGKSTLARALAPGLGAAPGALILRSDEIRKRRQGVAPEQRLPPSAYEPGESRAVMDELAATARTVLASGHSVIADATFLDAGYRAAIAEAGGARFAGIWLTAPLPVLEARVAARRGDASDADLAVLQRAAASSSGRTPSLWQPVDATDGDDACRMVRSRLRTRTC